MFQILIIGLLVAALRTIAESVSLPQRGRWIVEDETDEEVTNPQIARLLKTFSEGFDSSKK